MRSDYLDAHSNLTKVYAQLNQLDEAVATAQKALDVARSTGQTMLGRAHRKLVENIPREQISPDKHRKP